MALGYTCTKYLKLFKESIGFSTVTALHMKNLIYLKTSNQTMQNKQIFNCNNFVVRSAVYSDISRFSEALFSKTIRKKELYEKVKEIKLASLYDKSGDILANIPLTGCKNCESFPFPHILFHLFDYFECDDCFYEPRFVRKDSIYVGEREEESNMDAHFIIYPG